MTQLEINNLVKLLMSGDEQNILMAKAVCEGQNRIDLFMICYRITRKRKKQALREYRENGTHETRSNYEFHWQNYVSFRQVFFEIDEELASWMDASRKDYEAMGSYSNIVWSEIEGARLLIQDKFEEWKSNSFALSK